MVLALAGCPASPPGGDDDDPDGGGPDARPPSGLVVAFALTSGVLPAQLPDDVTLEEVKLRIADLCVLGDAAPCDERTSRASVDADWKKDGAVPEPVRFMNAPPGIYSRVELRLDARGGDFAWRLDGKVRLSDGTTHDFRVEDDEPLPLGWDVGGVLLSPGQVVTFPVTLDPAVALDGVDWEVLPEEDGKLQLSDDDPQIGLVRANVAAAFAVPEP